MFAYSRNSQARPLTAAPVFRKPVAGSGAQPFSYYSSHRRSAGHKTVAPGSIAGHTGKRKCAVLTPVPRHPLPKAAPLLCHYNVGNHLVPIHKFPSPGGGARGGTRGNLWMDTICPVSLFRSDRNPVCSSNNRIWFIEMPMKTLLSFTALDACRICSEYTL